MSIVGIGRQLLTPAVLSRWIFATEQIFKDLSVRKVSSDMPQCPGPYGAKFIAGESKHVYKHRQWNNEVDLPLA